MRRLRSTLAAIACAGLALAACDRVSSRDDSEPVALAARSPEPLPPDLARVCPLESRWWSPWERVLPFVVSWSGGYSTRYLRTVDGWETIDGRPHARVSYRFQRGRRIEAAVVEWLRPEGSALVVARRRLGGRVHVLEPPLPWIALPLEEGRSWTWEGTVDGVAARDEARVRRLIRWRGHDDVLAIEHAARVGSIACTRTVMLLPGLGVVGEEATYADEPGNTEQVWIAR